METAVGPDLQPQKILLEVSHFQEADYREYHRFSNQLLCQSSKPHLEEKEQDVPEGFKIVKAEQERGYFYRLPGEDQNQFPHGFPAAVFYAQTSAERSVTAADKARHTIHAGLKSSQENKISATIRHIIFLCFE